MRRFAITGNNFALSIQHKIKTICHTAIERAVKQCEVIIVAVPLKAISEVAKSLKETGDKIIIETSKAFGKPLAEYVDGTTAIKKITGNANVENVLTALALKI